MAKPVVFISCGQYTDTEKKLGEDIANLVEATTGVDAFFAQQQSDLNGLHSNILQAIKNCVGFIAVMHPRGKVDRVTDPSIIRASVWIEQEIAIAAYIQFTEKKTLPVVAFIHESINLEGIRTLLQLNPTKFSRDAEVLAALPGLLKSWKLESGDIRVKLESSRMSERDGHNLYLLEAFLINETARRIDTYDAVLKIPGRLLTHCANRQINERNSRNPAYREFRYDQADTAMIRPRTADNRILHKEYCLTCGQKDAAASTGFVDAVDDDIVELNVWIEEQEYSIKKTLRELHDQTDPLREAHSATGNLISLDVRAEVRQQMTEDSFTAELIEEIDTVMNGLDKGSREVLRLTLKYGELTDRVARRKVQEAGLMSGQIYFLEGLAKRTGWLVKTRPDPFPSATRQDEAYKITDQIQPYLTAWFKKNR